MAASAAIFGSREGGFRSANLWFAPPSHKPMARSCRWDVVDTTPATAEGLGSHGYVRAPQSGEGPKCSAARVQSRHKPGVLRVASPRTRTGPLRSYALSSAKSTRRHVRRKRRCVGMVRASKWSVARFRHPYKKKFYFSAWSKVIIFFHPRGGLKFF